MLIQTTNTIETDFQVLDAIVTAPPGTNKLAYIESGYTNLPINQQVTSITFAVTKAAVYDFVELSVVNVTDADPITFSVDITATSLTGFTIRLNGNPDTTSYYLRWVVQVPPQ
jgi:hypothetical protein